MGDILENEISSRMLDNLLDLCGKVDELCIVGAKSFELAAHCVRGGAAGF